MTRIFLFVFKRAIFAWLIADGDMHLKNLAMLKIADLGSREFQSVRMAPLYDAVTTRVFLGLKRDRLALKLNGKDDRLVRKDFRAFAATSGMRAADADCVIDEIIALIGASLGSVHLPSGIDYRPEVAAITGEMIESIRSRIASVV